ncbi:MAG: cyclic peptide export ABC transporter [Cyanobacteria bacterium J06649_5]
MNLLTLLLQSSRRLVAIALLAGLVSGVCSAQLIALINQGLNRAAGAFSSVGWFAGLVALALVSRLVSELLLIRLSQRVVYRMRLTLSEHILAAPLPQIERWGSPKLLAALTEDVQTVAHAVAYIPSACIAIAVVAGCLAYLCWLSQAIFLGFLIFLLLAVLSYQAVTHRAKDALSRARDEQDRLFFQLRSLTEGIKELKQNQSRQRAFIHEALTPTVENFRQYNTAGMTAFSIGLTWTQLLLFTVIGLVNFGLPQVLSLPPSVISGYTLTMIFLIIPLDALTTILPLLSKAEIALNKIEAMQLRFVGNGERSACVGKEEAKKENTKKENTKKGSPKQDKPDKDWLTLQFSAVRYAHPLETAAENDAGSCFELGPIDLTIHRQELIFLTGGNGSGKSTFAKLLTGLYQPDSGAIALDNLVITADNRTWYRQQFSVVFYDFHLFDRLLGKQDTAFQNQQINDHLDRLQLKTKVSIHEGQFSTLALSQGQRRRLALLVSYLEDRPFCVFDEWAADQDPAFRELFYKQLLPELQQRGKTVVVITHDDRYFHLADRVLKLDYGKIVERPSPHRLGLRRQNP